MSDKKTTLRGLIPILKDVEKHYGDVEVVMTTGVSEWKIEKISLYLGPDEIKVILG